MKIPRYQSNLGSAPIQSGRTLTTGTGGAQGMVNLGQTMLDSISAFAAQKQEIQLKLRDQEVTNLATLSEGDSLMRANDFVFGLEERKDYNNFQSDYDKDWVKHTAKVKKERYTNKEGVFDEYAWSQYEPFHNKAYMEGKVNVQSSISKARNAQSVTAYNTNFDATKTKISTSTSTAQVIGNWQEWSDGTFKKYSGLQTFDQGTLANGYDDLLATSNSQMMLLQSGENGKIPIYQNPNGATATDWSKVSERAADPSVKMYDVEGNELTVDDPARADFIKKAQQLSSEQDTFDTNQITVNDRAAVDGFNERLGVLYTGQPDPTFMDDVNKSNLSGDAKKKLNADYLAAVKAQKDKVAYWDTDAGKQTDAIVTAMVLSGAIDTEEEKSVIIQLLAEGKIKPERATALKTQIETMQKDANSHKLFMFKNAAKVVLKEAGADPNLLSMLDGQNMTAKDVNEVLGSIFSSGLDATAYTAVNNLTRIIAEGEKKGISMADMLINTKSPHYVINDLVQVYKKSVEEDKIRNYTDKADAFIKSDPDTIKFGDYRIDPAGWIAYQETKLSGQPKPEIPIKGENEGINEYLLRLQKWNKQQEAKNTGLPSFLRSDVVGGASTQGSMILPSPSGNQ
jgi:hypothetical protein